MFRSSISAWVVNWQIKHSLRLKKGIAEWHCPTHPYPLVPYIWYPCVYWRKQINQLTSNLADEYILGLPWHGLYNCIRSIHTRFSVSNHPLRTMVSIRWACQRNMSRTIDSTVNNSMFKQNKPPVIMLKLIVNFPLNNIDRECIPVCSFHCLQYVLGNDLKLRTKYLKRTVFIQKWSTVKPNCLNWPCFH